jgi:beta-galactosidase
VPDASNLLHFTVHGNVRIIGVGNGNPSSHEPDQYSDGGWQRHLFGGKCQVIVETAGPALDGYPASLTVSAEGLVQEKTAITFLP